MRLHVYEKPSFSSFFPIYSPWPAADAMATTAPLNINANPFQPKPH
ncbi:hypothetical protein RPHASCH2410_PD03610 (plasmid) [Rhizobium phaseoli Ch24-10]|nr:hypothetical protein RPHASCH2410_PD03610 [Rhizobium phaseoli Ch24-10]